MKCKKIILALVAACFVVPASQAAYTVKNESSREQLIAISDAFIPSGFDSSSEAFVVVSGMFPNSCYHFNQAKVEHLGPMLHEVRAYATVTEGLCLMVLVPFSREVQLGKLEAGKHSLRFVSNDGTFWEKELVIEK